MQYTVWPGTAAGLRRLEIDCCSLYLCQGSAIDDIRAYYENQPTSHSTLTAGRLALTMSQAAMIIVCQSSLVVSQYMY